MKRSIVMNDHDKTKEELNKEIQELQASNFRNLAENLHEGILIVNPAGQNVYANRRASELLHYSNEEILLVNVMDLIDSSAQSMLCQRLRNRISGCFAPFTNETIICRKDGSCFQAEVTVTTTIWDGQECDLLVIFDITHYGKIETEFYQGKPGLTTLKDNISGMGYSNQNSLKALLEINNYLEDLINYANAPIIVWDMQFKITRFNHAFEYLTGRTQEEVLGKSLGILFPDSEIDESLSLIRKTITGKRWETVEIKIQHLDNTVRTVLWNMATLIAADGKTIVSIIAHGQDITDRKLAEEAIKQSELKFRSLYANMSEGSALHNLIYNDDGVPIDYRIIEVNRAFENQLGISREAVINKTSREAYGVDEPPYFENYSKVALTGTPKIFETYFAPLEKYFSISVYRPNKGSFATIFENITKRKLTEQALRESEEKYRNLVDNSIVGILITTIGGEILYVNEALARMLEYDTVNGLIPQNVAFRYKYPEQRERFLNSLLQERKIEGYEVTILTARNHEKVVLISSVLEGETISSMILDMTDRKLLLNELEQKNLELKELNATKDKFFSIMAHDLKSPFNVILGFSEILKQEARNLDIDSIIDYADTIRSTAKQTFRLLENLLEWARMQQNGLYFQPKSLLLNNILKTEFEGLKYSADQKKITLINGIKDEIYVIADEKMISSVIRNLISNAIKFTPKEGNINVEAILKTGHVEVSVSDTGVGMEEKNIAKLFKIETSFTSRGTENETGSGLGLLLCREFIEKHGGKIWAESESGKGSKFVFSIPFRE